MIIEIVVLNGNAQHELFSTIVLAKSQEEFILKIKKKLEIDNKYLFSKIQLELYYIAVEEILIDNSITTGSIRRKFFSISISNKCLTNLISFTEEEGNQINKNILI